MATNFLEGKGTVVAVAAPSGGVSSGDMVVIRYLFGVAQHDAASGARVEIECPAGPVYTVPANNNLAISVGERVFWNATSAWVDKTVTAQRCMGVAVPLDTLADVAKATTATAVRVLLFQAGDSP